MEGDIILEYRAPSSKAKYQKSVQPAQTIEG